MNRLIASLRAMPAIKLRSSAVALACAVTVAGASAAPCRSESAATRGSQAGYAVDIRGADRTEQQDKSASDILGQCVAGITGVVTIPTFPSLASIFDQIKNEICRIASQQVHQAVGNVSIEIENAMRGIPTQGQIVTVPITPVANATLPTSDSPPTSSTDFWRRIWH
jgi:hypothetical protein